MQMSRQIEDLAKSQADVKTRLDVDEFINEVLRDNPEGALAPACN